ncbi:MAG: LAGLIDADG family homing endonuclease [Nanoarchaeota archaeon]
MEEKLDPGYIVGFTDGEGTFNFVRYPDGRIRPQFLLFNTNKEILEKIKKTLELDCPIFEVKRVKDLIKRRKICYRMQARSLKDIKKIVIFFDKNKPIIKKEDFDKFRNVYENWVNSNRNV